MYLTAHGRFIEKLLDDSLKILLYVFHRLNAALERHEGE